MDEGGRTPKRLRRSLSGFTTRERIAAPFEDEGDAYDVLIQLRTGWTSAELAAEPAWKVEALRWALYVERIWPESAPEIDAPFTEAEPPDFRARRAKAQLTLADLRKAIYPED